MSYVFISYSHADEDYALALEASLDSMRSASGGIRESSQNDARFRRAKRTSDQGLCWQYQERQGVPNCPQEPRHGRGRAPRAVRPFNPSSALNKKLRSAGVSSR